MQAYSDGAPTRALGPVSTATRRRRVALIVAYLSHFREPFYQALRCGLEARNVDLRLFYGVTDGHWSRVLDWAEPFEVKHLPGGATWFPVLSTLARTADLVVTEDASRHLTNYALLALRRLGGPKLVLWGHGWNHQAPAPDSLPERLKRFVGRRADGFLAYTPGIRAALVARGYDGSRIHDVRNTIPGPASLPERPEVEQARRCLGLLPDAQVALYCGQMYPMKRLELLVEAAEIVKAAVPRFELVLAGAGPTRTIAERAAETHPYVHCVGPVFDAEKARYFALSDVCVIPGIVGLAVVDAFHHHVPPIATRMDGHGPEIEYLDHEKNGLITEHRAADLAAAIERVLRDRELRERLIEGCRKSSAELGIDDMVARFVAGVMSTLDAESHAGRLSHGRQ